MEQTSFTTSKSSQLNVRLKAAQKKMLSQIVEYSMHCINYAKKRARKTSVVRSSYSKVTFHTITSSISLVTSYELCLACQHLLQIGLIINWLRN